MAEHPNIVLFVAESYRGDVLGHHGNRAAVTPNLDAIVANGAVSYTNAFSQSPVCSPSRCSFMTGCYPHVNGHRSMRNLLKDHEPHLLKSLRKEGYWVWWGGKNDLVALERSEDISRHCDVRNIIPKDYPAGEYKIPPISKDDPRYAVDYRGVADINADGEPFNQKDSINVQGAIDAISTHSGKKPFCIYLPLTLVHPPYATTREFYDLINPDLLPQRLSVEHGEAPVMDALRKAYGSDRLSEAQWKDVRRVYYAMCSQIDDFFGRVVSAVEAKGVYDNTLILFFSDHGDFTGDYGLPEKTHCTLQDCLLNVPLIIKPHASLPVKPGLRQHLTELIDIPATIYDLLGIDPGYDHQGISLRGSLEGDESELRDAVFAEVGSRRGETAFKNMQAREMSEGSFYRTQSGAVFPFHDDGKTAPD